LILNHFVHENEFVMLAQIQELAYDVSRGMYRNFGSLHHALCEGYKPAFFTIFSTISTTILFHDFPNYFNHE